MKSKVIKSLLIATLSCSLAFTAIGCGVKETQTVATYNGQKIEMGMVNLFARYQQSLTEASFDQDTKTPMWSQSFYGQGTYESYMKGTIMSTVESLLILESHAEEYGVTITDEEKAAIDAAAEQFLADNDAKTLEKMTATKESVTRLLTLMTLQPKMREAMVADVDTNVEDSEIAQRSYSYILENLKTTDDEGQSVDMDDEEKAKVKEKLAGVITKAQEIGTLTEGAKEVDETLQVNAGTYGSDDTTLPTEVKTALDELGESEIAPEVIETSAGYYVVQLVSDRDESATEEKRKSVIEERKNTKYQEIYTEWQEASDFEINERNWAKVNFIRDSFRTSESETESVESTEAPATGETESQDTSATDAGTESDTVVDTQEDTSATE